MRDLLRERDHGGGPQDALAREDPVDDVLEFGVGAGDDAAQHVAGARDRVRLEDLRDPREPLRHRLVADGLAQFEGHERGHRVAERRGVDPRPEVADDAARDELVEPRLHGPARHPEPPGALQDPDARFGFEEFDEACVERVDAPAIVRTTGHIDQCKRDPTGTSAQVAQLPANGLPSPGM